MILDIGYSQFSKYFFSVIRTFVDERFDIRNTRSVGRSFNNADAAAGQTTCLRRRDTPRRGRVRRNAKSCAVAPNPKGRETKIQNVRTLGYTYICTRAYYYLGFSVLRRNSAYTRRIPRTARRGETTPVVSKIVNHPVSAAAFRARSSPSTTADDDGRRPHDSALLSR